MDIRILVIGGVLELSCLNVFTGKLQRLVPVPHSLLTRLDWQLPSVCQQIGKKTTPFPAVRLNT